MKVILLILVYICYGLAEVTDDKKLLERFKTFSDHNNKSYVNDAEEDKRFGIYKKNIEAIDEHNQLFAQNQSTYEMRENHFTDMDFDEIQKYYMGLDENIGADMNSNVSENACHTSDNCPDSKDWRETGAISYVKNQGKCGSCWAFAAIASIEAYQYLKTNQSVDLSEQDIVNCVSNGCGGGRASRAINYAKLNGTLYELSCEYEAKDKTCSSKRRIPVVTVTGYVELPAGDEQHMKKVVGKIGPVSVSIEVTKNFMNYGSGVYMDDSCIHWTNHAVLVVGYGTENGHDYWLVKNSWGTQWGDQGYIKMARNKNNQCFIATRALYPLVEGSNKLV